MWGRCSLTGHATRARAWRREMIPHPFVIDVITMTRTLLTSTFQNGWKYLLNMMTGTKVSNGIEI
jgi:hypothetical protein